MITTLLLAAALQNAPMANTAAPAAPSADVPHCSKTVTDGCVEGGTMASHKATRKAHHKKMVHKKVTTTKTAPAQ